MQISTLSLFPVQHGQEFSFRLIRKRKRENAWKVTGKLMITFRDNIDFSSVQFSHSVMSDSFPPHFSFSSVSQSCPTPWTAAYQASLSITNFQNLLKVMSLELVMPSNHLIPCHPPSPPVLNFSQHQNLFQWVSSLHQITKVLELQHNEVLPWWLRQ